MATWFSAAVQVRIYSIWLYKWMEILKIHFLLDLTAIGLLECSLSFSQPFLLGWLPNAQPLLALPLSPLDV